MVITPHVISGCIVAVFIQRLTLGLIDIPRPFSRLPKILSALSYDKNRPIFTLIFCAGMCSHLALDYIPHCHYSIFGPDMEAVAIKITLDASFSLLIFLIAFRRYLAILIKAVTLPMSMRDEVIYYFKLARPCYLAALGAVAAILPDIINVAGQISGLEPMLTFGKFHDIFHSKLEYDTVLGYFLQSSFVIIMVFVLINQIKKLDRDIFNSELAENFERTTRIHTVVKS